MVILCFVFSPIVSDVPRAALVAVMVLVSFSAVGWRSIALATLKRMPTVLIAVIVR
ncbi:MAG: hypothetical protein ABIQ18_44450 [Umezawaea sp.]